MATSGSSGKRPSRRPAVGSRTPTARPRRVAGRALPGESPTETEPPVVEPNVVADEDPSGDWPDETAQPRRYSGRRATAALVAAIVVLAGIAGAEAWYLWGQGDPVVSSSRPVVTSQLTASAVTDTAATAVDEIISASYETYDEQVDEASSKMTSSFAEEYVQTKADIKEQFVEEVTEVSAEVSARGVVTASPEQVVALVFLTQTTTKDGDNLAVAQFKVRVTMVKTDSGWLVSDLQTQ